MDVSEILRGEWAVSAETAVLLGRHVRTSAEFWMNLQSAYDLPEARRKMPVAA